MAQAKKKDSQEGVNVGSPLVVLCPGCEYPMEAQGRTSVTERLVDIRYLCATCGMETKRTIKDER
jgi:hypothetical protein